MKIAILSWGALLLNSKGLSIGKWNANGPSIQLEFSRISRDGRLTPVIDEHNGAANRVSFALSKCKDLATAINQFRKKEKINQNRIGVLDIKRGVQSECCNRHPNTARAIRNWAIRNKIDAVIFSDLGIRFKNSIDVPFSPANALNYVNGLPVNRKRTVLTYIKRVSKKVKTPFTQLVNG